MTEESKTREPPLDIQKKKQSERARSSNLEKSDSEYFVVCDGRTVFAKTVHLIRFVCLFPN